MHFMSCVCMQFAVWSIAAVLSRVLFLICSPCARVSVFEHILAPFGPALRSRGARREVSERVCASASSRQRPQSVTVRTSRVPSRRTAAPHAEPSTPRRFGSVSRAVSPPPPLHPLSPLASPSSIPCVRACVHATLEHNTVKHI